MTKDKRSKFYEAGQRLIEDLRKEKEEGHISAVEMLLNEGGKNKDRVDALLYVIGMILERESDKYKAMEASLSYNYRPIEGKFTNVILCCCKVKGERKDVEICFQDEADFLDVMAEVLTKLKEMAE